MWRWIKVPKAIALIAFFLPWLTVSCSSTVLLTASGWSLATGHLRVVNPLTGVASVQQIDANGWLVAALVVIVIGLAASIGSRRVAVTVLITSIAALALVIGGTLGFSQHVLADEISKRRPGVVVDRATEAIRIDRQIGYWIELAALIATAGMAGLVVIGRDRLASVSDHRAG